MRLLVAARRLARPVGLGDAIVLGFRRPRGRWLHVGLRYGGNGERDSCSDRIPSGHGWRPSIGMLVSGKLGRDRRIGCDDGCLMVQGEVSSRLIGRLPRRDQRTTVLTLQCQATAQRIACAVEQGKHVD